MWKYTLTDEQGSVVTYGRANSLMDAEDAARVFVHVSARFSWNWEDDRSARLVRGTFSGTLTGHGDSQTFNLRCERMW